MRRNGFKVIKTEKGNENVITKRHDWLKIATIIGAVAGMLSAIVACVAVLVTINLDKKAEVQYKPSIDLDIVYSEDNVYIDGISVGVTGNGLQEINIKVEPFYNIIYFHPTERILIKQMLPITDYDLNVPKNKPLNVQMLGQKSGEICRISYNDNTRKILENQYSDVYLCETGYVNFSGHLTSFVYEAEDAPLTEEIEYNIECMVNYAALKTHNMDNGQFGAKLSKVNDDNIFYSEYHLFSSNLRNSTGKIVYVPGISEKLDYLIEYAYVKSQLLFYSDDSGEWKKY